MLQVKCLGKARKKGEKLPGAPFMKSMHSRPQLGTKSRVPLIDLGGFHIAVYTTKGVSALGAKIYSAHRASGRLEVGSP